MRIIQIIDSLDAGGAERMAVNYANVLADEIQFSGLVSTRKEGILKEEINPNVSYLFLKKQQRLDFKALFRLRSFVVKNKVSYIHAHSTSFFLAFLLKITLPSVKLIWHLHYGGIEFMHTRKLFVLRLVLPFFNSIIAVNQKLKEWTEKEMHAKNVIYLPNFPLNTNQVSGNTILKGIQGKRIVSLANLREDKDHFLLLEVAKKVRASHQQWTFHLVGKDFEDDYSKKIKKRISKYNLENHVFVYGSRQDISAILAQADITVLTSKSEGLPVALLEYGLYKKAVVVTRVGEVPMIIQHGKNGFIVDSNQPDLFYQSLEELILSEILRTNFGNMLYDVIQADYTAENVMKKYLKWLKSS
ncbi:glycosyltransferase [Flavobacterium flavigenum]|uniref:glycosyltransferase n=1 Tax=Flavobacterium flavigenum TaxID=3003258 RepID=UPI0022AC75E2|nr:glycosyltransferase [Flavobacterium flavigenum]